MAAGIRLVGRHVVDARRDGGFDFVRPPAPELHFRRPHVFARLVFECLGQAREVRQGVDGAFVGAQRPGETADLGLAVGARGRDVGVAARSLQRQQLVELGALGGRTSCRRRRELRDEDRVIAVEIAGVIAAHAQRGPGPDQRERDQSSDPSAP